MCESGLWEKWAAVRQIRPKGTTDKERGVIPSPRLQEKADTLWWHWSPLTCHLTICYVKGWTHKLRISHSLRVFSWACSLLMCLLNCCSSIFLFAYVNRFQSVCLSVSLSNSSPIPTLLLLRLDSALKVCSKTKDKNQTDKQTKPCWPRDSG